MREREREAGDGRTDWALSAAEEEKRLGELAVSIGREEGVVGGKGIAGGAWGGTGVFVH